MNQFQTSPFTLQTSNFTSKKLRPFSKNPTICKFMIQLGRFDEPGSGVRNINRYLPLYAHGAKPVFKDTIHGFELTIPLTATDPQETEQINPEVTGEVPGKSPGKSPGKLQGCLW
jgi:ATP-dependent DNA helicase RecG